MPSQTFTSSGTFNVPAGVTVVDCQAWGEGGNGANGIVFSAGGGGGGGGEYAEETALSVSGGGTLTITIGSGGSGTDTAVTGGGVTVTAHHGANSSGNAAGAKGTGSTNSVHFDGGAGGTALTGGSKGGGGGSSAGTASIGANGTNGTSTVQGTGGTAPAGGGNGGDGASTTTGNGSQGTAPGGGGGGGGGGGSPAGTGAAGQPGQVTITWTVPQAGSAQFLPGPTWFDLFKPWMPRPRPPVPPSFINKVDVSGSVAMAPMALAGSGQVGAPPQDLPAIRPGPAWLSMFKPGWRPHRPPVAAPPSGPNPANQPNLSDVPQIRPGPVWLGQFKPGMPRPLRPQVPDFPSTTNPGSVAMAPMGMSGTITVYPTGSGSVAMAPMAVSGTAKVPIICSGSMAMAPSQYGTTSVHVPVITSGSVAMAPMAVFTPPFNQDVRSLRPGPVWRALFKKPVPGQPYKISGGPQYIGVSGSVAMAPMGYAAQVIQYLPFPQFPLSLKFELLINGTWLDITGYVYGRNDITITRGLPDETQSVTPAQMTLTLNNRDGRFSPNNPLGAYSPYLTRNVQMRCSVVNQASADGNPYSGYRFWGEVSNWPPRWDPSGADIHCDITVSGVLRRYVQAASLGSTLRQYYTSLTGNFTPNSYWPCEDGQQATEIASALASVGPVTFTGAPQLASDSAFGGSDPLPVISSSVWHCVTSAAANPPGTGSITQKFPGTYHFTAPPGVTAVTGVVCTGAGGGGGDQNTTIGGGGGGGGGAGKAASVTVTPGVQYTYVVGAGGAAGAGGDGVAGADSTFTGDSQTVSGHAGKGGRFGGTGGAGGAGPTFNGGAGAAGSAGTTVTQGDEVIGHSGGSGSGSNGGQTSASWTAPTGITGTVNIFAQGAGGGGQGGGNSNNGLGGGGGGGGGKASGTTTVSAGDTLTFYAGNGGAGGSGSGGGNPQAGGAGGDSSVSDGSVTAHSGGGGSANGSGGGGGAGNNGAGGSGGTGGAPQSGQMAGGGGGGGAGGGNGGSASGRSPGAGSNGGAGGGWGATSSGGSGATTGGTSGSYGGGGGGGGSVTNTSGTVGGGGAAGYIQWNWQVTGVPSGGGGGSSAGTSTGGSAGSSNGTGGTAPAGGGAGGNSGTAGASPGGGGGGGVPDAGSGAKVPGAGAAGQVAFSWSGGTTSPVAADIVRFCLHVNSAGAADGAVLMQILTYGTIATINVVYHTGGKLELIGLNASSAQVFDSGLVSFGADGTPLYVSVEITASGANATWKLSGIKPGATTLAASASGTVTGASVGNVSDIFVDPNGTVTDSGTCIGQITYQTYADTLVNLSPIVNGYAGETAAARISRLCSSQGIGFELVGSASDTPLMGPQTDDTFVSLLQACADLDRGQLFETRDQFGIGYRTRVDMQGQNPALVADYSLAELASSLQPTADDQYTRNSITVTRNGGASSVAQLTSGDMSILTPPNGVGIYSQSLTVQAHADSQLANLGAWLLTVGTVSEYRYPSITFDMARVEVEDLFSTIPGLDIGDFVQVINPPFFLQSAPINQLAFGFTETLNAYTWTISINTVPESPYSEGNPPTW